MTDRQKRDELLIKHKSTDIWFDNQVYEAVPLESFREALTEYDTWLRDEAIKIIGWYLSVDVPKLTPNEIGELQSRIRTAGKEK